MSHCIEFFEKWKKEENFCGIGKVQAGAINRYLETVNELVSGYSLDEKICYKLLPSSAITATGFLSLNPECPLRKVVLDKIAASLKDGKKLRRIDVVKMTGLNTWTLDFVKENCQKNALATYRSNHAHKLMSIRKAQNVDPNKLPWTLLGGASAQGLEARMNFLKFFSSQGQINILQSIIDVGDAANLYDAYCTALTWASEIVEEKQKDQLLDKPSEKLIENTIFTIGMKVKQIKGNAMAYGSGKIISIQDGKYRVQFSNNLKILTSDQMTIYQPPEVKKV